MTTNALMDALEKAGKAKLKQERACAEAGGHYQDRETTVNGKPAWKCRCGFAAPKTARIWRLQ